MAEIIFLYEGQNIKVQCNKNEKMKDIFNKFIMKTQIDNNSVYYLYKGNKINEELEIEKLNEDINNIKIIVNKINEENKNNNIIKSKDIICPECKEKILIKIKDYIIELYDCKNGHNIKNILLDEYEKTQYIDISKIICDKCKEKNKSNIYNNEIYRCINCKMNLCPLCKLNHDKTHDIINYDMKDYICEIHKETFIKYCNECKKNLCLLCNNKHKTHNNIIHYEDIIPDIDKIKEDKKKLRNLIDNLKNDIKNIINELNKIVENIEIFYNIYEDITNIYEKKNRNYEIIKNINEINSNNIIKDLEEINNDNNINKKIINILNIYNKMNSSFNKIKIYENGDKYIGDFKNIREGKGIMYLLYYVHFYNHIILLYNLLF